jgi:hypothetical protein
MSATVSFTILSYIYYIRTMSDKTSSYSPFVITHLTLAFDAVMFGQIFVITGKGVSNVQHGLKNDQN